MTTLPEWMCPQRPSDLTDVPPARGRSVARRTLNGLARLLAEMVANDATAASTGLLQRLEPRAKVLGLLALVVTAALTHDLRALALGYVACLLLAAASRVPARRFAGTWLAAPLVTTLVILPATLNVITPGKPVWTLPVASWAVTDTGLRLLAVFVLRTAVCVSLALLLAVSTTPARLFRGLRALGVPKLFVMLLLMMERYLAVIVRAAEEMQLARLSRGIAPNPLRQEQALVAAGMGALFRRTQRLGDTVYLAMISRGYTGEVYLLEETGWTWREWVFLVGVVAVGAGMVWLG